MTSFWLVMQRESAASEENAAIPATGSETSAAAPSPATASFVERFDLLVARGQVAQAVRSALVLLAGKGPENRALDPQQREALLQRLVHLLPQMDQRLAAEALRTLRLASLDAEGRQAVLASALRQPPSRLRTEILRQQLTTALPATAVAPALADPDPRIRAAAARALRQHAELGDRNARTLLDQATAQEADPRVRQALTSPAEAAEPTFGEDRKRTVELPPAAARAPARTLETLWDMNSQGGQTQYTCHSTITIAPDGRARVETVRDSDGEKWHVRYDAWAWVDAKGTVVVDGRGQNVEYLAKPPWGDWSPDSLQIAPNGATSSIDDRRSEKDGETAIPGSG